MNTPGAQAPRQRAWDKIPELTLGQAIGGEIGKGITDPEEVALSVMSLYSDEWLSRRLIELLAREAARQLRRGRVAA